MEEDFGADGGFPAGGGDFDELAVGIGEVEEDALGDAGRTAGGHAAKAGEAAAAFAVVIGAGFEVMQEGGELAGGGQGGVAAVELAVEPVAEGGGAHALPFKQRPAPQI